MTWPAILLAVQNHDLHQQIKRPLLVHGAKVLEASSHPAIHGCFDAHSPRLLILEAPRHEGTGALEIVAQIRNRDRRFPIILVTCQGSDLEQGEVAVDIHALRPESTAVAAKSARLIDLNQLIAPAKLTSALKNVSRHVRSLQTHAGFLVTLE